MSVAVGQINPADVRTTTHDDHVTLNTGGGAALCFDDRDQFTAWVDAVNRAHRIVNLDLAETTP